MKGKLFEFNSSAKDWVEKGIGFIKLNKSQENEKYRLCNYCCFYLSNSHNS